MRLRRASAVLFRTSSLLSSLKTSPFTSCLGVSRVFRARYSTKEDVPAIVTGEWLQENISRVRVVDASYTFGKSGRDHKVAIPGATYIDVDEVAAEQLVKPHTFPSASLFARTMDRLGITNDDYIVVYDHSAGQFIASARVWWMFRAFGHTKISALEGGFQFWPEGLQIPQRATPTTPDPSAPPSYRAVVDHSLVWTLPEVVKNQTTASHLLVDVRVVERFRGIVPEPRPGVPSGSIPGSYNMPYPDLFKYDSLNGVYRLKDEDEIKGLLMDSGVPADKHPIVTSCGSGLTAAITALALHTIGIKNVAVYDGSWTEYGTRPETRKVRKRTVDLPGDVFLKFTSRATGENLIKLEQKWDKLEDTKKISKIEEVMPLVSGPLEYLREVDPKPFNF